MILSANLASFDFLALESLLTSFHDACASFFSAMELVSVCMVEVESTDGRRVGFSREGGAERWLGRLCMVVGVAGRRVNCAGVMLVVGWGVFGEMVFGRGWNGFDVCFA